MEHSDRYFANDVNTVVVPGYTIFNVTAELRKPIVAANGWGVRGFVTVHNVANRKYIVAPGLSLRFPPDPVFGNLPLPVSGALTQSVVRQGKVVGTSPLGAWRSRA